MIETLLCGVDYSQFGRSFYEEVPIAPIAESKLFWVNADWFNERGLNLDVPSTRLKVEQWLLGSFAVRVCDHDDSNNRLYARADRYGGISGTAHGGSGRCAYRGRFNVKGIGETPLVPKNILNHRDGKFLLLEALRGAIYAELVNLESDVGAVRAIAIISIPPFDVPPEARLCLMVRPNFIRPAHAERSLLFGTAGFAGSDQFKDHERVTKVRAILSEIGMSWSNMATNAAFAIGSLDASRMTQGRFTSSNMSILGEVADFESFRVFDSWAYTQNIMRDQYPLGKELDLLERSAVSWAWLLAKTRMYPLAIRKMLSRAHREGFVQTAGRLIPSWDETKGAERLAMCGWLYDVHLSAHKLGSRGDWVLDTNLAEKDYNGMACTAAGSFGFTAVQCSEIATRMNHWRKSRVEMSYRGVNAFVHRLISVAGPDWKATADPVSLLIKRGQRLFKYDGDWCH